MVKAWVRTEEEIIASVIVANDRPAGNEEWNEYPFPSDIGGPANIAGRSIHEFDENGNFL